jgi:glycosyltransferase involved in cell wall biosynthesis
MRIYIQTAAYRDSELVPTVYDAIVKAANPKNLVFGLFSQTCTTGISEENDWLNSLDLMGATLRVKFQNYAHAKGLGWARAQADSMYDGEDFYLQIDSHMRFVQDWDTKILDEWSSIDGDKHLLTHYPPAYTPPNQVPKDPVAHYMAVASMGEGSATFKSVRVIDKTEIGYCTAGGFLFGPGKFWSDVPVDEQVQFGSDELLTAIRAYTNGYDIYHPGQAFLYHYYKREKEPRFWDDHKDRMTHLMNQRMVRHSYVLRHREPLALGTVRTLDEYIEFSGVDPIKLRVTERSNIGYPNLPSFQKFGSNKFMVPTPT